MAEKKGKITKEKRQARIEKKKKTADLVAYITAGLAVLGIIVLIVISYR